MDNKRNPLGPTGEAVRANVRRLRGDMSYAELSRRLKATGRAIPELGLRRIEEGERRVDVDDLLALAEAFETTPIALLMPTTTASGEPVQTGDELVQATGRPLERGKILWKHLQGLLIRGLGETTEPTLRGTVDYRRFLNSTPPWVIEEVLDKVSRGNG